MQHALRAIAPDHLFVQPIHGTQTQAQERVILTRDAKSELRVFHFHVRATDSVLIFPCFPA
jgi:hypothetical protein